MSESIKEVTFSSSRNEAEAIRGRFVMPANVGDNLPPVIILLSGDGPKGTKSLSWVNLPPIFATRGIASFLFDFAGLGYSLGERSSLTLQRAMEDFGDAWDYLSTSELVNTGRVGVFGSSFGATVALARPDLVNSAKLLGLKSPASFLADAYVNEGDDRALDAWISAGHSDEFGYDLDVLKGALRANVYTAAEKIEVPTLISHGSADTIVPIRHSKFLALMLGGVARVEVFEGVGHTYSEEGAWDRMAQLFTAWFSDNL